MKMKMKMKKKKQKQKNKLPIRNRKKMKKIMMLHKKPIGYGERRRTKQKNYEEYITIEDELKNKMVHLKQICDVIINNRKTYRKNGNTLHCCV